MVQRGVSGRGPAARRRETKASGRAALQHREVRRFGDDHGGQLLILTGVLLVLGFVVIAATFVQLRAIEETTARTQRNAILETVESLVASLNQTIQDSVILGETNVTDFQQVARGGEDRLKAAATQAGLYLSAELDATPDPALFWRDSRCGAYSKVYSNGGVIVGHDRETQKETIAGAVYDLHVTDGKESIRMTYYVRIFDCMLANQYTYPASAASDSGGTVWNLTAAASADDGDEGAWLNETLTGSVTYRSWKKVSPSTIQASGWNQPAGILEDDTSKATHPSPFTDDYLQWRFDAPSGMAADAITTAQNLFVHARHNAGLTPDDVLKLTATYPGQTVPLEWTLTPITTTEANFTVDVTTSPTGNAYWTKAEVEGTTWTLWVQEVGGADVLRTLEADFAIMDVTWTEPEGFQTAVEFTFEKVPIVYTEHWVDMRYQVNPGTSPAETFQLQVWNTTASAWDTIASIADTGGAFLSIPTYKLADGQENGNAPIFRINDLADTDDLATDVDRIVIDHLTLTSKVDG